MTPLLPALVITLAPSPAPVWPDVGDTAEDVEIMRRVLVHEVGGALTSNAQSPLHPGGADQVMTPWSNRFRLDFSVSLVRAWNANTSVVTDSDAYCIPGVGAIVTIEAVVPVTDRVVPPDAGGESADLWSRIESDVRRGADEAAPHEAYDRAVEYLVAVQQAASVVRELDENAVRNIEDAARGALVQHGHHFGDLADDDTITIAVHLTGRRSLGVYVPGDTDGEGEGSYELAEDYTRERALYDLAQVSGAEPEERLVLTARVGDLRGGSDAVQVTRY